MKIRIRPDDPSMLKEPDWRQMNEWLAELRDDGRGEPDGAVGGESDGAVGGEPSAANRTEPTAPGPTEPTAANRTEPTAPGPTEPTGANRTDPAAADRARPHGTDHTGPTTADRAEPYDVRPFEQARGSDYRPEAHASWPANRPVARAGRGTRAEDHDSPGITVRAIIGDQLRIPVMWCEMGSCISWHTDPAALGEADTRARAIDAGWRVDALGRLACPRCQQTDPGFRASHPVALWNREEAITMAARISVVHGDRTASTRPFPVPPRD